MSTETEVSYYCPYCETEVNIAIQINGPTDYYVMDECCPNCDASIDGGTIDQMAADAVSDYYITDGDLYCDIKKGADFV